MSWTRRAALLAAVVVAGPVAGTGAGCHDESWLQYEWDDRRILCSHSIDDVQKDEPWSRIEETIELAGRHGSVALLHAHEPHVSVSVSRLRAVFDLARRRGLDFVTYGDFESGAPPRAALALAFDDHAIDAWFAARELLAEHGARVTFFVSAFFLATPEERAKLAQLAAEGHSVQAHSVRHLDARKLVDERGVAAYLAEEAEPSIEILRDAGYAPTAYAYPFGVGTAALDEALLQRVERVRVGPRPCPY